MIINFLYPEFLFFLFLIPLYILIYFLSFFYNKKKAVLFSNFSAMERIFGVEMLSRNFFMLYLNIAIVFLLVLAISGMSISFNAETSSFAHVIAVDNSGSMKAVDIAPNRLDAAKDSAKRFVEMLPIGVKIGVISFAGDAKIIQELDNSKIKTKIAIDSIDFGDVAGTNIYNAVLTANKILQDEEMKSVVLISDGQLNVGEYERIISYARRNNIVINTIAEGTAEGGLTESNTISKVDEDMLKALAFNTDGKFFRAENLDKLDESFNELLRITNKEIVINLSFYLMIAALVLLSLSWVLYNLKLKTLP